MSRCLAIFHKQLGDLVLLEPTLRRLSRASGSKVDLITRSGFRPLISLMPHVDFLRSPSRRAYDVLCGASMIERNQLLSHSFQERAKSISWSTPERQSSGITQRFSPWSWCPISVTLILQSITGEIPSSTTSQNFQPPELRPPPKEWAYPLSSKNYLHVNPTSGWKSKNWTAEKWAETINQLIDYGIGPIVMTSGKQEWQKEHLIYRDALFIIGI
jgi:ADP-heptose:LPS heptosyltransferase